MTASNDMSTPVTRGELREELGQLETRIDGKLERLETRIDGKLGQLETRIDQKFDVWAGALLARIADSETRVLADVTQRIGERIGESEQRLLDELARRTAASEQRLSAELAGHVKAIQEAFTTQISVVDDKYRDLPARVRRLEARMPASKRR